MDWIVNNKSKKKAPNNVQKIMQDKKYKRIKGRFQSIALEYDWLSINWEEFFPNVKLFFC